MKKFRTAILLMITLVSVSGFVLFSSNQSIEEVAMPTDCVIFDEVQKQKKINWNAISSEQHFERCLLDLAHSMGNPDDLARWFVQEGFSNVLPTTDRAGRIYMNAIWDGAASGESVPFYSGMPLFKRLIVKKRDYVVQVTFENDVPILVAGNFIYS